MTIRSIYHRLIRPATSYAKYAGTWAIVTGSSYGSGKSFAIELAKRGLNVVLIARSKDKLEQVAKEITTKYKVKSKVIATDFHDVENCYSTIAKEIDGLPITILINNAGGSIVNPFRKYLEYSLEEEEKTYLLNELSVRRMTRLILPQMLERRDGILMNVGSLAASFPQYLIPYETCKCKINAMTEALAEEYRDSGVKIGCAIIGAMSTPHLKDVKPSLTVPHSDRVAKDALDLFGIDTLYVPYWMHAVQYTFVKMLPKKLRNFILRRVFASLKKELKSD